MKFEYGSKSQEYDTSGTASATKVILVNSDGAIVPVLLPAKDIDLSNIELLEKALEVIYEENFPNRAENEKFDLVGQKIAQADDAIARMNAQMDKQKKESAIIQSTIAAMTMKFYEKGLLTDEDLFDNIEITL